MRRLLSILVLTTAAAMAAAAAPAADQTQAARALMRASGAWDMLGTVQDQLQASLTRIASTPKEPASEVALDRLASVARSAFETDKLRATATRSIARGLDSRHLPALLDWYESPVGAEITRLEAVAARLQTDPRATMINGGAQLQRSTPLRRQLIDEVIASTRASDAGATIAIGIALAMQRGMAASTRLAAPGTNSQLRAQLEAQRGQMIQAFDALFRASFALTYEQLPDQGLQNYVAFLRSPAGQHFNSLVIAAIGQALNDGAESLARSLRYQGSRTPGVR